MSHSFDTKEYLYDAMVFLFHSKYEQLRPSQGKRGISRCVSHVIVNQNTSAVQWYFFHAQNSGKRKDDHSCSNNKGTGTTFCLSPALGLLPLLRRRLHSTAGGTQTSTPSTIHYNSNDTEVEQFYSLLLTYYAFTHSSATIRLGQI